MTDRGITAARLAGVLALVTLGGCGGMPAMSSMGLLTRTSVPAEIAAPANQKLGLIAVAEGVQIYRCDAKAGAPAANEWALQAAEAILRDPAGKYLGKQYGGPTWEAEDGSKIIGTVDARREVPGSASIPWLRLKSRAAGGTGLLSGVTTVLRVATAGGNPPPAACNALERGRIARVNYTADYYFYIDR